MAQEKPSDHSVALTPVKGKGGGVQEGAERASDGNADWIVMANPTSHCGAKIVH